MVPALPRIWRPKETRNVEPEEDDLLDEAGRPVLCAQGGPREAEGAGERSRRRARRRVQVAARMDPRTSKVVVLTRDASSDPGIALVGRALEVRGAELA